MNPKTEHLLVADRGGCGCLQAVRLGPGRGLRFATAPNFESPGDDGADNVYRVNVKVKDAPPSPALPDSTLLEVTVTNVDEEGTVTLPPTALRVGLRGR